MDNLIPEQAMIRNNFRGNNFNSEPVSKRQGTIFAALQGLSSRYHAIVYVSLTFETAPDFTPWHFRIDLKRKF